MRYLLLSVLLMSGLALAAIEGYEFSSSENESRFHSMTHELRCPTCQNQNIADSDAPLAADLRREVHRMIEAGESDQDIIDFMVLRFGDFVHYRPRVTSTTWFLWYGPYVLLALGFLAVIIISRKRRSQRVPQEDGAETVASEAVVDASDTEAGMEAARLSPQEQQQLQKLLQQEQDK
ncbi:cytochrome c-type biogenesis protein [Nitrincola sp. MINF-07-Sa-05]|uniref:cytochrome c-type biogenesis protein n=1 Tax=Nitrincola salilacus TaxID=3400273 RepID=UPI0039182931